MRHQIEIMYDDTRRVYVIRFVGSDNVWRLIGDDELDEMMEIDRASDIARQLGN